MLFECKLLFRVKLNSRVLADGEMEAKDKLKCSLLMSKDIIWVKKGSSPVRCFSISLLLFFHSHREGLIMFCSTSKIPQVFVFSIPANTWAEDDS